MTTAVFHCKHCGNTWTQVASRCDCHITFGVDSVGVRTYDVIHGDGGFKAVVNRVIQRPSFTSRGAAKAFADAVARGVRHPEPTGELSPQ